MRLTPEQIERIQFLRASGRSVYSISVDVGCSMTAVYSNSKAPWRAPDTRKQTCSAGMCRTRTTADAPICPDCLPRFDVQPVKRGGAELDHAAVGRVA